MGSPLGVTFANFYMCNLENNIFQTQPSLKPTIYCRYIDNIFIVTPSIQQLQLLKNAFEQNSVLKFTIEIGFNNKINFLDVNINNSHEHVVTQPFIKPTNSGIYLNYNSKCPLRYKDATIRSMIHRTYKASSTYEIFIQHINILKQAFINNSYPKCMFDKVLHAFLNN